MRPGDSTVVFDRETWKLGTRGLSGNFDRPKIRNMRMTHDGILVPRPYWRKFPLSGTSTYFTHSISGVNSIVVPGSSRSAFSRSPSSPLDGWVEIQGPGSTTVRFTRISAGLSVSDASATSIGTDTGPHAWVSRVGDFGWLINGVYVENTYTGGPTVVNGGSNLDTLFSGANTYAFTGSCMHQGRGFHWGPMLNGSSQPFNENRIYFSDLFAPATFTSATQFFDMDWTVSGCASLGSVLLIWGHEGNWAALQGGRDIPTNGTIVPLGQGRVPAKYRQPAVFDGKLVFLSADLTCLVTVGENGEVDDLSLGHLGQWLDPVNYQSAGRPANPAVSSIYNSLLVPYAVQANAYHNYLGVWTEEDWGFGIGDDFVVRFNETRGEEQIILLSGSTWTPYYRPLAHVIEGPTPLYTDPVTSTFRETVYSDLRTPRVSIPNQQVRLTRVIVDGRYWGSDDYDAPDWVPTFDTNLATGGVLVEDTTVFSDTTAINKEYRYVLRPQTQPSMSAWFDVRLDSMKSIGVERITVEFEASDQETW